MQDGRRVHSRVKALANLFLMLDWILTTLFLHLVLPRLERLTQHPRQLEPVMPLRTTSTALRTLDGLHLAGTLVTPEAVTDRAVVLIHGGGVTREEGGFFTRLATGLGEAGVASLRFDLRGHGESEGTQAELTLAAILNDIRVALAHAREATGASSTSLLGASFGGGICAYYAAKRPDEVVRLVLLNPQLDYKKRTIDSRDYWSNDYLSDEKARELTEQGHIQFTPTFRHGRALLNEVFWLQPHRVLGEIKAPTLIVHGTKDTFVPIESSRAAVGQLQAEHRLVEIEDSQHGFAVHDDPQYLDPQSQEWQAFVIRTAAEWVTADS
jgi:pimeloyl-ACP methyl ester carboxylesterase